MIPKDLLECFDELKKWGENDPQELIEFKSTPEKEIRGIYHHTLGREIRNEWGLWRKSDLYKYFETMGLHHPDDMSGVILLSFHRHLNGKDLQLAEQILEYKNYWQKLKEKGIE